MIHAKVLTAANYEMVGVTVREPEDTRTIFYRAYRRVGQFIVTVEREGEPFGEFKSDAHTEFEELVIDWLNEVFKTA